MTSHFIASLLADFYKIAHREQYPDNTKFIYSTWTPRASRVDGVNKVVVFGNQRFIKKYLIEFFHDNFFSRPKDEVVQEYTRFITNTLGVMDPPTQHIADLHDLGYMPLLVRALPEGTRCPIRVPMLTVENTDERFFWLTNFIETLMSCELWMPATSATTAHQYKRTLTKWANTTGGNPGFVPFQGHDFSMRGMACVEAAASSGSGHLLSFVGTDTIPAITELEYYYNADITKELVGTSVYATEHSVMCAGGAEPGMEEETYRRLIQDVYPKGIVSIVSDTWDLWAVLTQILPRLKGLIMSREGKVVIRPDSGDPVKILTGYKVDEEDSAWTGSECVVKDGRYYLVETSNENRQGFKLGKEIQLPEVKGVVELLWETFGGTINSKGFKELDPHIGAIYGDAITLARAEAICSRLADKGFASTNVVLGIGSYTYQYVTRDTFGFALKSTHCVIGDEDRQIFKDPKTDHGIKKSLKGRVSVVRDINGELVAKDLYRKDNEDPDSLLVPIFRDGMLLVDETLDAIRKRLDGELVDL